MGLARLACKNEFTEIVGTNGGDQQFQMRWVGRGAEGAKWSRTLNKHREDTVDFHKQKSVLNISHKYFKIYHRSQYNIWNLLGNIFIFKNKIISEMKSYHF